MPRSLLLDIGIGLLAGYVTTKITEQGQSALWTATPRDVRDREQAVRPGPPFQVAARKMTDLAAVDLTDGQTQQFGMALHYAAGIGWGPVYCVMRQGAGMSSVGAAVATGASMSVLLDELITPAFGFSAPNRDYPTVTHIRGAAGHLLYGLALAGAAEGLYRLVATTQDAEPARA